MTDSAGIDSGVLSLRFRQRPWQLAIDLLLAAWITLLTVSATFYTALGLSSGTVVVVWLLALAVSVPLAVRRRRPVPVFSVVLVSAIAAVLLGMSVAATVLAVAVALYSVALSLRPRRSAVVGPHFLLIAPNTKSFNTSLFFEYASQIAEHREHKAVSEEQLRKCMTWWRTA